MIHYILSPNLASYLHNERHRYRSEIGWSLSTNENRVLQVMVEYYGNKDEVLIPGYNQITCHTHPDDGEAYYPPSPQDLIVSIWNYLNGLELNMVVDATGIWFYRPTETLLARVYELQPNIKQVIGPPLQRNETSRAIDLNQDIRALVDNIVADVSVLGIALGQMPDELQRIADENDGCISEIYNPIDLNSYIHNLKLCGFHMARVNQPVTQPEYIAFY